jgi:hypothetical protein
MEIATGWVTEPVATGGATALLVDREGVLQALYFGRDALFHARRDVGGWAATELDAAKDDTLAGLSLAEDASGVLHAVYVVRDEGLRHATGNAAVWTVEEIGGGPDIDTFAVALDGHGGLHVLFVVRPGGDEPNVLRRLSNASGTWEAEDIATGIRSFTGVACAFDATDALHAVAHVGNDVVHFTLTAAGWTRETIRTLPPGTAPSTSPARDSRTTSST